MQVCKPRDGKNVRTIKSSAVAEHAGAVKSLSKFKRAPEDFLLVNVLGFIAAGILLAVPKASSPRATVADGCGGRDALWTGAETRRRYQNPGTRRSSASSASGYNDLVPIAIRNFEKSDFDTLWKIDQACFDSQLAYTRPELAFYIRRPGAFTLVAESTRTVADPSVDVPIAVNDGRDPLKVIGFIVAENSHKTGHIITLDVMAEARRLGVGSRLMREAEAKLMEAGTAVVTLETPVNNLTAIRFYKHEGYFVEKTVAGYYSGQLDALLMVKDLMVKDSKNGR